MCLFLLSFIYSAISFMFVDDTKILPVILCSDDCLELHEYLDAIEDGGMKTTAE